MTTFAVARLIMLLFASAIIATTAYLVPGVNPHSYQKGEMYVYICSRVCIRRGVCLLA